MHLVKVQFNVNYVAPIAKDSQAQVTERLVSLWPELDNKLTANGIGTFFTKDESFVAIVDNALLGRLVFEQGEMPDWMYKISQSVKAANQSDGSANIQVEFEFADTFSRSSEIYEVAAALAETARVSAKIESVSVHMRRDDIPFTVTWIGESVQTSVSLRAENVTATDFPSTFEELYQTAANSVGEDGARV